MVRIKLLIFPNYLFLLDYIWIWLRYPSSPWPLTCLREIKWKYWEFGILIKLQPEFCSSAYSFFLRTNCTLLADCRQIKDERGWGWVCMAKSGKKLFWQNARRELNLRRTWSHQEEWTILDETKSVNERIVVGTEWGSSPTRIRPMIRWCIPNG